jgi:outer membrane protein assembly factor BamB
MKRYQTLCLGFLIHLAIALALVVGGLALFGETAQAATSFNNEGISSDNNTTVANYDGVGNSYSNNALTAAGFTSGKPVMVNGISFQWPTVAAGSNDNWQAAGQVISIAGPTGGTLGFLGSSTNGPSSGTATLTYSDNSTQTFTLAFSDWTLNGGSSQVLSGDSIAATMSYRNTPTGQQTGHTTYVFYTSVALTAGKTLASVTLPSSVSQGHLHVFAVSASADWTTYNHDLGASGYNSSETTLNVNNFPNLTQKWKATGTGGMSDQPIVVGNVVYWGSWDGNLHATNITGANFGKDLWTRNLGVTSDSSCLPPNVGVASTPAYGAIGSTPTLYVGGGGNDSVGGNNVYLYAVNATNGSITWKTVIGSSPDDFAWSSPVLYNGSVYYGLASFGDCPLTRGRMIQLNASTGAIQHTFYTEPSGCTGGGIWGSPSIDTATGKLYIATGTQSSCQGQAGDYGVSLLELNTSDLSYVASWQIPPAQQIGDADFGSAPTLFTGTISGTVKALVGVANKDGIFYTFDRSNVAAGPVWTQQVASNTGSCPQCDNGSIAPAVWDGSTLYAAGGQVTISGTTCKGSVDALDPSTGAFKWQHCLQAGPVLGSLVGIPGVVVATQGAWINALDMSTGATIFRYQDQTSGATYYSPVSIANGYMFAPNLDGSFVAFSL